MEDLSAQDRKRQDEVTLWQEQQKLEDQMVKDLYEVNGVLHGWLQLTCPLSKTDGDYLMTSNFKKKLLKANLKVRKWDKYRLYPFHLGFTRQLKKDAKLFFADSEIGSFEISVFSSFISVMSKLERIKNFLTKFIYREKIVFYG